ncbi:hypothetical protein WMY93_027475 [Mugilogobius chulae]|uniref:G-protein coupled receptors family 1 profile domain-containing protein n=1 Tax=Mugilogobius chulae TaxID=88201 RepID=A0AAW0N4V3_9GOBI
MLIVCASYVLLLRYVRQRSMNAANSRRRSRVTRSVAIVVLSFFCCWMPNHAITLWGVLVKLNAVHWDKSYYLVHTYVFPVTVCLAHTNSCLNPVLYCLMRPEIRKMLSGTFWKVSTLSSNKPCARAPLRTETRTGTRQCSCWTVTVALHERTHSTLRSSSLRDTEPLHREHWTLTPNGHFLHCGSGRMRLLLFLFIQTIVTVDVHTDGTVKGCLLNEPVTAKTCSCGDRGLFNIKPKGHIRPSDQLTMAHDPPSKQ